MRKEKSNRFKVFTRRDFCRLEEKESQQDFPWEFLGRCFHPPPALFDLEEKKRRKELAIFEPGTKSVKLENR